MGAAWRGPSQVHQKQAVVAQQISATADPRTRPVLYQQISAADFKPSTVYGHDVHTQPFLLYIHCRASSAHAAHALVVSPAALHHSPACSCHVKHTTPDPAQCDRCGAHVGWTQAMGPRAGHGRQNPGPGHGGEKLTVLELCTLRAALQEHVSGSAEQFAVFPAVLQGVDAKLLAPGPDASCSARPAQSLPLWKGRGIAQGSSTGLGLQWQPPQDGGTSLVLVAEGGPV